MTSPSKKARKQAAAREAARGRSPGGRPVVPSPVPEPTRFTDAEIWDLDRSLAAILADGVARLREMEHGYPMGIQPDEWVLILTRMEEGFRAYGNYEADDPPYAAIAALTYWWAGLWD